VPGFGFVSELVPRGAGCGFMRVQLGPDQEAVTGGDNRMTQRKILLSGTDLKQVPGRGTSLSVNRLKGMVAGLLTEAGLDYALVQKGGAEMIMIEMVLSSEEYGVKRVIHFKLEVPQIYVESKRGPAKYLEAASWRFFHDYLERRLAAVRLGITDLVEEFSANIVLSLPDGTQGTLAEFIKSTAADPDAPLLPFILEAQA